LLAEKINAHDTKVWLVNTGWSGGGYGTGRRMSLSATRAIIDAIHSGALVEAPKQQDEKFGVAVPTECPGVDSEILLPRQTWLNKDAYDAAALKLAKLFHENFKAFLDQSSPEIAAAGPIIGQ
jgi:phosphoenolpyruvate carboxykinase (ATP)